MKVLLGVIVATTISLAELCAQNTAISWSAFNSGFAETASATTSAQSVAGQLVVGSTQSTNTAAETGFLPGTTGSGSVTSTLSVTTMSDTGEGSLRWAVQTANATPGLNLIRFNIPGNGVHTITPASPLPAITASVIIDGYSQPGASPNTNGPGLGSNAVLLIELNGINTSPAYFEGCLILRGGHSTVRGLVINRAPNAGISLLAGGNNIIEGNFIGTDPTGTMALGNSYGITIESENNDLMGGEAPASRNVISGNTSSGIAFGEGSAGGSGHLVQGNLIGTNAAGTGSLANLVGVHLAYNVSNVLIGGTTVGAQNVISGNGLGLSIGSGLGDPQVAHNLVQGNLVGTDVTGTGALGNTEDGIDIVTLNNTVGGTTPEARNIVSGNGRYGLYLFSADSTVVQGNSIGIDITGKSPMGNQDGGLYIVAHDVLIGGTVAGTGNTIAFNGTLPGLHAGVAVIGSSSRDAILGNSIFSNVGLGIDLGNGFTPDGVTPNDSCDVDTLVANNYQNYPVLTSALPMGGGTVITGTLDSRPNELFRVEFFSSPTPDSTGYGEGETFLGVTTVMTNASCIGSFVDSLPVVIPPGYYISSTATDMDNNTSEFSLSLAVGTTLVNISTDITAGWNMISNPVTSPVPDDSANHLFPTIISRVFEFDPGAGYQRGDTVGNGKGYWGKFPAATTNTITGMSLTRDTLTVAAGWNMLGSISTPVDTSTIVSVPPGLRASNWFGWSGAGYIIVTRLAPGQAFWLKSDSVGMFVLATPLVSRPAKPRAIGVSLLDALNALTITDSRGGSQTLYFGPDAKKEIKVPLFDMPPPPPVGTLDARFETAEGGSMVRTHDAQVSGAVEFPVKIRTDAYPVTVTWKMKEGTTVYEMMDGHAGHAFQAKEMTGEGSIKIINPDLNGITVRLVGEGTMPNEFALAQNYPNPFNPSTTFKYDLPIDTRVTLKVFNILGQEVASLVNEEQKAGYKSVQWNASNFATGVYFYRLDAGNFASVKKLILVK